MKLKRTIMAKQRIQKNKKQGGSSGQNRKKSSGYLEKYKAKPNVKATESGLLYEVIKEGDGNYPSEESYVTVHQRAMLVGGKVLDDTYQENEPMEFKLSETVAGYREGVLMMRGGSRYKFVLPPEIAWGKKGSGGRIGPNAVVIFDVSLIDSW